MLLSTMRQTLDKHLHKTTYMTFTITETQFYMGIVVLLMVIQIYQQSQIKKLQKESEKLWDQIGTFISTLAIQLTQMQKEIDNKQNKKDQE